MKRLALIAVLASCSQGDQHAPAPSVAAPPQAPMVDPLAPYVIPPELVMEHQAELGLTVDQQKAIVGAIQSTQAEMVDLQWKMVQARDALVAKLAGDPLEEPLVLERADAIFALEREVKRRQLSLVVRIRNVLTAAQRERLRELRGGK